MIGILVTALLTACVSRESAPPASKRSPSPTMEATSVPTAIPIQLSGPSLGSAMLWLDGSTLIYIPSGEFRMGGNAEDNPERAVTLSAFWIYSTKVTNGQYAQCVEAEQCAAPGDEQSENSLSDPLLSNRPVTGINWEQAALYCQWMGGTLPTEAQWEKTARGPDGNTYPWGDSKPSCGLLNFKHCLGRLTNSNAYPAGMSLYGALDMAGNVFEWTADWYDPTYYSTAPVEDPTGPIQGEGRSVRGSSFESAAESVPVSHRSFRAPDQYGADLGFRCVLSEPKLTAPYCQFTASDTSGTVSSPTDGCQITVEQTAKGCQTGNLKVTGVTLESINPVSPLTCTELDEPYIQCQAPRPYESGEVTVCGACSELESAYYGAPTLGCYPSYKSASTSACQYAAGSSTVPNGCPAGAILIGDGYCGILPSADGLCLPGTYFDPGAQMCVGFPADQSCRPGHTFDEQSQCCRAAGTESFPCQPGEYLAEYFGCLPMPGQENFTSCATVNVTLEFCMCYTFTDSGSCAAAGCKWIWNKNPPNYGRCDATD